MPLRAHDRERGLGHPERTEHSLAGPAAPGSRPTAAREELQQLLDSWGGTPAYVRDRFFDVLMANKAAMLLAPLHHPGRNLVRDMVLEPAARTLFPNFVYQAEPGGASADRLRISGAGE